MQKKPKIATLKTTEPEFYVRKYAINEVEVEKRTYGRNHCW